MPILRSEPGVYPDSLWDAADDGSRWLVLHTKPRQEKSTARELKALAVPYFLPMGAVDSRSKDGRRLRTWHPLFASYLFLRGDDHARVAAIQTHRLVRVLEVDDQVGLARDLRNLHALLSAGLPVRRERMHAVGDRVVILNGALAGVVGVVERRRKADRFVAIVTMLGRGASIELRDYEVEPVRDKMDV